NRIRHAVGVGFEHAIRDSSMVSRAPEIAGAPAEDLRASILAIAQDEPERPEPGHPVIRIVQAELGTEARDLPLRGELRQGQLDAALHLFGEQHHFSSSLLLQGRWRRGGASWVPLKTRAAAPAENPSFWAVQLGPEPPSAP